MALIRRTKSIQEEEQRRKTLGRKDLDSNVEILCLQGDHTVATGLPDSYLQTNSRSRQGLCANFSIYRESRLPLALSEKGSWCHSH